MFHGDEQSCLVMHGVILLDVTKIKPFEKMLTLSLGSYKVEVYRVFGVIRLLMDLEALVV